MRTKVKTDGVNTIKVHVRPIDWTNGNVYGIRGRFTGELPVIKLLFGEGKGDAVGFCTWDLDACHEYPNDPSYSYIVEFVLSPNNIIDYIEPCCGDCEYEFVDLSGAPDIISAYIKHCRGIRLRNNHRLEKLVLNIEDFPHVDFFGCENLRELTFSGGEAIKELDLTHNDRLEHLVIKGYASSGLRNIKFSNSAKLKYIDMTGVNLHLSCLEAIKRIIERNNGEIKC